MTGIEPRLIKLEDSTLWKEACNLAEYMYSKLHEFPEDEKWETVRKIRMASNDIMFYTAQAVGSSGPSGSEYEWGHARKQISALKTMYRFAGRQRFIELEPEIMVKIDKMLAQIDQQAIEAHAQTEARHEKELDLWRAKYKLWKEMQE